MLKFFKKMEKTRNFLLILFAVVMVISLIVFGALPGNESSVNLLTSTEIAVEVGNRDITVGQIATLQSNMQQPLPSSFLVNNLIQENIMAVEAEKLGLGATDAEVASRIREMFKSPDGKPFDQNQYEATVIRNSGSVQAFEDSLRNSISREKLISYITSGVTVSEEEVLNDFKKSRTKFDLIYVPVNTADVAEGLTPSDEELKAYFEKNKKAYFINSPQKKIRYVYLETAKVGEKLTFSDEELKEAYDKLSADRKQKGVEVQEIVLRIPKPDQESQTIAKANEIISELKKGEETVSEENFAKTAQGQSENPNTASNGGRVKGLVRENTNNPTDPYQRILNMKEGEITEPLQYQSNVYILRRGRSVPKTFEDAKKELEVSRRNTKAYTINAELAEKVSKRLKETKNVEKTAEEFASEANMQKADMLRETKYIVPGDEVEHLGISQDFEQGIVSLAKPNDVGEKIPVPGGFAIPLLVDKKDPRDATFEEVKSKVSEDFRAEQAREKVEAIAKAVAKNAENAEGVGSAAKSENLEALEANDFVLGSPLGQGPSAATSDALEDAIFDLKKGDVFKAPIKVGDNWYVVGVKDREEANLEDFAKERDQLYQQTLGQKQSRVFLDYIASVKQKMESKGEIKIYKEVLDKIDQQLRQQTQPAPPQIPQIPPQPPQNG